MTSTTGYTWHALQEVLMDCTDESSVEALIKEEKSGPNRPAWLKRMNGRLRVLRAEREDRELFSHEKA